MNLRSRFSRREPAYLEDDDFPRYRWVIIGQVVVQQQMGPFVFGMLGIMLPAMQAEIGFGGIEAGWIGAARSAGNLLVFMASILLVRFSPIKTFNIFSIVLAAALLVGALAPSFPILLGSLAIYSVGMSWGQIPMNMIRQQWIPRREMASVMGAILALSTVVSIAGLILLPIALKWVSWRAVFGTNFVILLLVALCWHLTAYERISPSYSAARRVGGGLGAAKHVLRRREFYLLGTATLGGATTFMTFMLFLPTYYIRERGISLQTAGIIVALVQVGGFLMNLCAGMISDRIGRRKPLIWPSGLVLPFLWFMMLAPLSPVALGTLAVLVGAAAWMPFSSLQAIPLELENLTPSDRAVGQALQFTLQTSGQLLAPLFVGAVAAQTGSYRSAMLPMVALPVLFTLAIAFLPETGPRGSLLARAEPVKAIISDSDGF